MSQKLRSHSGGCVKIISILLTIVTQLSLLTMDSHDVSFSGGLKEHGSHRIICLNAGFFPLERQDLREVPNAVTQVFSIFPLSSYPPTQ